MFLLYYIRWVILRRPNDSAGAGSGYLSGAPWSGTRYVTIATHQILGKFNFFISALLKIRIPTESIYNPSPITPEFHPSP